MKVLHLAAVVGLITGGTYSAHAFAHVEDADQAKVASCTFVKDVSAPTTNGKHTREALGTAMEQVRADAEKAGATHIVWKKIKNADVSSVSGKAYHCGS
jgi:hypothetical protein